LTGLFGFGSEKKKRKGISSRDAMKIARGQKFRCSHCSKSITQRYQFQIDHIDGDGSDRDITNLQALCTECHSKKSHRQTKERVRKARKVRDTLGLKDFGFGSDKSRRNNIDVPSGFLTKKSKAKNKNKKSGDYLDFGDIEI
jgi:hypothetical protein